MIHIRHAGPRTAADFALQIPFRPADGKSGRRSLTRFSERFGRLRMHATQADSSSMPAVTRTAFRE